MPLSSAVSYYAMSSGYYSTAGITSGTNVRDVSDILDLWAHRETPFLNLIEWGPDSGGNLIEWISENLGWGYFELGSLTAASTTTVPVVQAVDPSGIAAAEIPKMIQEGCLLYYYNSADAEHGFLVVQSATNDDVTCVWLLTTSLVASTRVYILGNVANEGSDPRPDTSRVRTVCSNKFTILRKDVNVTGSQAATNMYAVNDEIRQQIKNRLLEMQREREMMCLLSYGEARSTTQASYMNGLYGFLQGQSGSHIDTTTTSFTESAVNAIVAACYENGGTPNAIVGSVSQIRKFTGWDRARVRSSPDDRVGGFYISHYLTDVGLEVQLVPMRKFPLNLVFAVDTTKIKLRAKNGRKLIVEKLGKTGDYDMWQLITEFSLEVRGYNLGQHGMLTKLVA